MLFQIDNNCLQENGEKQLNEPVFNCFEQMWSADTEVRVQSNKIHPYLIAHTIFSVTTQRTSEKQQNTPVFSCFLRCFMICRQNNMCI